jgi:hypothetical protein
MANPQEVELNLTMTPDQALMLVTNSALNFIPEQTERFEVLASTKNPLDPEFREGIVFFCDTASDAVLLMSFENASGYDASALWIWQEKTTLYFLRVRSRVTKMRSYQTW